LSMKFLALLSILIVTIQDLRSGPIVHVTVNKSANVF
jgi:hypothetical protein